MEEIWVVISEWCCDGSVEFSVVPCANKEVAEKLFKGFKEDARNSLHFKDFTDEEMKEYEFENTPERYYISDDDTDYYCDIYFEKKPIQF